MSWFLLMAQPSGGGSTNTMAAIAPIALIVVIFYFLLIRPQQKRTKQHRSMTEALKAGDKVVTVGGIRGTVVGVDQQKVILRIADNVKITLNKSAVAGVQTE